MTRKKKITKPISLRYEYARMDIPDTLEGLKIREMYWYACNTLRELIGEGRATKEEILSELEEDL